MAEEEIRHGRILLSGKSGSPGASPGLHILPP
jgi:hypothetical protein